MDISNRFLCIIWTRKFFFMLFISTGDDTCWTYANIIGNGNSARLWLVVHRAPLIPIAPGFSLQCDLGRWRPLKPRFALCVKLVIIYNMQLCGFNCITWYSICILVIFPMYFYCFNAVLCVPQGVHVANKYQMWSYVMIIGSLYQE